MHQIIKNIKTGIDMKFFFFLRIIGAVGYRLIKIGIITQIIQANIDND